jgi:glycosyltransferase 2 family protein
MRRYIGVVVKLLFSAALIAVIAWKVGPAALLAALGRLEPGVLVLALLLTIGFILGRSWKWMILARSTVPGFSFREAVLSLMGGMGLGMITPGRAGEFSRVAFMPAGDRVRLIGLFAVDRAVDLQTIILFGTLALPFLGYPGYFAAATAVTLASIACLYLAPRVHGTLERIASRLPFQRYTIRMLGALEGLEPRRVSLTLLASIAATLIGYAQFYVLLRPYARLPVAGVVLTFSIMILSNLVPITIGGLGVREALSVMILRRYGVSDAVAVNAAFLSFLTNTVLPGVIGSFLIPRAHIAPQAHAP